MKTLKITTEVNGEIYKSEVTDRVIRGEEDEQIASCIGQVRKMLDKNGLTDANPDFIIERRE